MMRRASRFVSFAIALLVAGQTWAQEIELNNVPPAHGLPHQEIQAAFDQAKQGHIGTAVKSLRAMAKDSAETSLYLAILLFAWRQQLAREGRDPMPPVDWEMDWLRCSVVIEGNGYPASFLVEYYENNYVGGREISGRKSPRLPGPGRAPDLAACWSAVSEKAAVAQDCLDLEKPLRAKRQLPAFACPPSEPTKASIEKYPAVKIAD